LVGELGFRRGHRWTRGIPLLRRLNSIHRGAEHSYFLINSRADPIDKVCARLSGLIRAHIPGTAGERARVGLADRKPVNPSSRIRRFSGGPLIVYQ
jgi:hypothetical protein